jgi:hypothetical protein
MLISKADGTPVELLQVTVRAADEAEAFRIARPLLWQEACRKGYVDPVTEPPAAIESPAPATIQ